MQMLLVVPSGQTPQTPAEHVVPAGHVGVDCAQQYVPPKL